MAREPMAQNCHAESWKEDFPPDQQRLDEEIRELEALQRNVAQRLRCALAKRACAVAKHRLQQAERELLEAEAAVLQTTEPDELQEALTYSLNPCAPTDCKAVQPLPKPPVGQATKIATKISLNPCAPTDCKAVHETKAMRKRARRRQRQLELVLVMPQAPITPDGLMNGAKEPDTRSVKSEDTRSEETLALEPERQEPEPETVLKPVLEELPKPPEGLVQQRIASFDEKEDTMSEKSEDTKSDNAVLELELEPERQELEPENMLKPVLEELPKPPEGLVQQLIASYEAKAMLEHFEPQSIVHHGLALAHDSVDAETPAEALLADASEDSSDDAESDVVHQFIQEDVKLEPNDELEPEAQVAQDEHHGSSPHFVASNGVGAMSGDELTSDVQGMPAELEDKARVIRAAVPRIFSSDWAEEIIKDARALEVQNAGLGLAFLTYMAKDLIEARDAPT